MSNAFIIQLYQRKVLRQSSLYKKVQVFACSIYQLPITTEHQRSGGRMCRWVNLSKHRFVGSLAQYILYCRLYTAKLLTPLSGSRVKQWRASGLRSHNKHVFCTCPSTAALGLSGRTMRWPVLHAGAPHSPRVSRRHVRPQGLEGPSHPAGIHSDLPVSRSQAVREQDHVGADLQRGLCLRVVDPAADVAVLPVRRGPLQEQVPSSILHDKIPARRG